MMRYLNDFESVGIFYDAARLELFTEFNESVMCTSYMLNDFHPSLLELPLLQSYTKSHAMSYVPLEQRTDSFDELVSQVKTIY